MPLETPHQHTIRRTVHIMPTAVAAITSEDLLKSIVSLLTRVPKKDLKNYYSRHSAANLDDFKTIQSDWKVFSAAYDDFKKTFADTVANNEKLQRYFVQLATASAVLGKINPENDPFGLYAGCALFVSMWTEKLGQILFPNCTRLAFFALWSPFLQSLNIDWKFHGTFGVLLITLGQMYDDAADGDAAFALVFPGPAPSSSTEKDKEVEGWASKSKHLPQNVRDMFKYVFGLSGNASSRQIQYFNPANDDGMFQCYRSYENCWAIDSMPVSLDIEEFEKVEPVEPDEAEYKDELKRLQGMLLKAAVNPSPPNPPNPPNSST